MRIGKNPTYNLVEHRKKNQQNQEIELHTKIQLLVLEGPKWYSNCHANVQYAICSNQANPPNQKLHQIYHKIAYC